jgi:hypothetical protein
LELAVVNPVVVFRAGARAGLFDLDSVRPAPVRQNPKASATSATILPPQKAPVFAALDDEGGPLISHSSPEEQQRSFDSTCRKFHRFLEDNGCGG